MGSTQQASKVVGSGPKIHMQLTPLNPALSMVNLRWLSSEYGTTFQTEAPLCLFLEVCKVPYDTGRDKPKVAFVPKTSSICSASLPRDGQTDRQTDRQTDTGPQHIPHYADASLSTVNEVNKSNNLDDKFSSGSQSQYCLKQCVSQHELWQNSQRFQLRTCHNETAW